MATRHFSIVLSAYYPGGRPVDPLHFIDGLGVADIPYEVYGTAQRYGAVGLRVAHLDLKEFGDPNTRSEVHDDYENAIRGCFLQFVEWLARLPQDAMARLRADGLTVWVIVNLWIDCDQMDLRLPPALSAQLGRLDLELCILSNE